MPWPSSDVTTTNTDAGTDSPQAARANLLDLMQKFNELRNHFSTWARGFVAAVDPPAARTALGASSVGSNVFTAVDQAAARSAISAASSTATVNLTGAQTVAGFKTFSDGWLASGAVSPVGYTTGAGVAVTQLSSKSTLVSAGGKPSGVITTHNAALAAGASVNFIVTGLPSGFSRGAVVVNSRDITNYEVAATDAYEVMGFGNGMGFVVRLKNISGGSRSEAVQIAFSVGVIATS